MSQVVQSPNLPTGWSMQGTAPHNYLGEIIKTEDGNTLKLSGKKEVPPPELLQGFGTVMQCVSAKNYLEKKIRLSAKVKADLSEFAWSGIWMRVDDQDGMDCAFDNMYDRKLEGSTDWVECEVVLRVPSHSAQIAFGILLRGSGEVAIRDIAFSVAPSDANETGPAQQDHFKQMLKERPLEPTNLTFAN